jgi:chromate transporter
MMEILRIFGVYFRAGAFTLGGGLAMISVLRHELIVKRAWVGEDDFAQDFAAATTLPGAMGVNFSLFSGYRIKGASGAAAAFVGTVLPSFIAIMTVALFLYPYFGHPQVAAFLRGATAAVAGLMAHTAAAMCAPIAKRAAYVIAAIAAAALALVPTVNPIFALILVSSIVFRVSERKS